MTYTTRGIYMADEKQNDDDNIFEVDEEQKAPAPMPKPVRVKQEPELLVISERETNEEDDESYAEIVEPFTTANDYVFSMTAIQDEDGERFVTVQMDNTTIELPLQDVIEMVTRFASAIPKLISEASKKD
jgi:hypothetical protein